MDDKINELVLLINTYVEHHPNISLKKLRSEGFNKKDLEFAKNLEYIKETRHEKYTMTSKGIVYVSNLKISMEERLKDEKNEFYRTIKREKRIVPPTLKYRKVYSKIMCPLCGKQNMGVKYLHNICADCDKKISKYSNTWNKIKSKISSIKIKKKPITIIPVLMLALMLLPFFGISSINDLKRNENASPTISEELDLDLRILGYPPDEITPYTTLFNRKSGNGFRYFEITLVVSNLGETPIKIENVFSTNKCGTTEINEGSIRIPKIPEKKYIPINSYYSEEYEIIIFNEDINWSYPYCDIFIYVKTTENTYNTTIPRVSMKEGILPPITPYKKPSDF